MEDTASELPTVATQRGWPSPGAIAAAVAAHAALLAWLVAHPMAAAVRDDSAVLTVRLVAPPADPVPSAPPVPAPAPADPIPSAAPAPAPAQADGVAVATEPHAGKPKSVAKPSVHPRPPHGERPRQKPKKAPPTGVYTGEGTQEVPQGTAVYQVLVGRGGMIESIALAHSSGTPSYDAAGVAMIRNSMTFDPPPANSPGAVAMLVTISFSPAADQR